MSEDEEIDFTPKLNCGVWTAIENVINKENNEMIWDYKNVPAKVTVARKKEKFRVRWGEGFRVNRKKKVFFKIVIYIVKSYHRRY